MLPGLSLWFLVCAGEGEPNQERLAWLCRVKAIPDGGQGIFLVPSDTEQSTAACRKWMMGYVSTIPLTRVARLSSARHGVSVLSSAEGTVATRADTVSVWHSGAYDGW